MVIKEQIAEVTGLPTERGKYSESKDARSARVEFTHPGNLPLVVDRQGTR